MISRNLPNLVDWLMNTCSLGEEKALQELDLEDHFRLKRGLLENEFTQLHYTDLISSKTQSETDNRNRDITILPVHGDFGTEVSLEAAIKAFAELGCKVRIPLMRGHGFSPRRSQAKESSEWGYSHVGIILEDYKLALEQTVKQAIEEKPNGVVVPLHFSAAGFWGANYFSGMHINKRGDLKRSVDLARERQSKIKGIVNVAMPYGEPKLHLGEKVFFAGARGTLETMPYSRPLIESGYALAHSLALPIFARMPKVVRNFRIPYEENLDNLFHLTAQVGNLTWQEMVRLVSVAYAPAEVEFMQEVLNWTKKGSLHSKEGLDLGDTASWMQVPLYFVNGDRDGACPPEMTRAYAEKMPRETQRTFYSIREAGHADAVFGKMAKQFWDFIAKDILKEVQEGL